MNFLKPEILVDLNWSNINERYSSYHLLFRDPKYVCILFDQFFGKLEVSSNLNFLMNLRT